VSNPLFVVMKRTSWIHQPWLPGLSVALLVLGLLNTNHFTRAVDSTNGLAASGGIIDAEIRTVIDRVVKHQICPLADGDYSAVQSLAQARMAKVPEGITWDYPWGVTLNAVSRSTALTGDQDAEQFVSRHNLICARYCGWLAGLEKQFDESETRALTRSGAIKQLMPWEMKCSKA
jgi:hypothetical protein